jgi:hypothetical protein
MTGLRLLSGAERAQLRRPGMLGSESKLKELFETIEPLRWDTFRERPVVVLRMTPRANEGGVEEWLFDDQTGLLAAMRMTYDAAVGKAEAEIELGDWKDVPVEGEVMLKLPHRTSRRLLGHEQIMTIERVTHNGEVDAALFAVPDSIRTAAQQEADKAKQRPTPPDGAATPPPGASTPPPAPSGPADPPK